MRLDLVPMRGVPVIGTSASLLAEWRVGTILQAVATRDASSGQLFLNMGDSRYPVRLASGEQDGPSDGERLTLRVLRNSPVLALERVAEQPRTSADEAVVSDALRKYVPKQSSPAPLAANLAFVARETGARSLPPPVAQVATKLWEALPDMDAMSDPMSLERALSRSGTFLEAALAKDDGTPAARSAVASDIKTLMLQFARVLREHGAKPSTGFADTTAHAPLPSANGPLSSLGSAPATLALLETPFEQMNELARQTDGALARLTTTQVTNSAQDGPVQSMLIEVPVRHDDRANVLRFRIERDGSRQQQGTGDSWAVEAALDLGAIGALHARVSLTGFRVGVQLRADSPAIVDMLNARAPELESMLRDAGLEVDRIICRHGMPAADTGQRLTRLLDVRA
jgi:Flagellar hook-length control protein FliK